jgi:hypothetical protein
MNAIATYFSEGKSVDDRLSPILVKELRQGMRARLFVLSFLGLQIFLVLLTLGNLVAQNDRSTLDTQSGFFWTILGFALLVLTPLRGLVAVSQEVKNRTLETIMLTRLTAWRVVIGKWSALFAQSVLLVSAVLPYVVVRYFIGGEDIVDDFKWIFLMLWLSGLLSAGSIAISGLGNPVFRIFILIGIVIMGATGAESAVAYGMTYIGGWETLGWLLVFGFFVPALLFELTASGIAPASENHAIRRRLLAVLFFVTAVVLESATHHRFLAGIAFALLALVGVCYFELTEKPRLLPRMAQAFGSRGWWGRSAGLFLLPGWPSGLIFSLLVIPAAMVFYDFVFLPPPAPDDWLFLIFAVLGSILVPISICHFFWPKMNQVLLVVFFYNLALGIIAGICEAFQMLLHAKVNLVLAVLPGIPTYLTIHSVEDTVAYKETAAWHLLGNGFVLGFLILALFLDSRGYFRNLFQLYRSGGKQTAPEKPAA